MASRRDFLRAIGVAPLAVFGGSAPPLAAPPLSIERGATKIASAGFRFYRAPDLGESVAKALNANKEALIQAIASAPRETVER